MTAAQAAEISLLPLHLIARKSRQRLGFQDLGRARSGRDSLPRLTGI
jgi:hypothetical protein